jgi:DNA-binding Lrp family transcriptional regulator
LKFDELDIKILYHLTKDSRISFRKIAEEIAHGSDEYKNINSSTVFRRFKRLKKYLSFNTSFEKELIHNFNLIGVVVNIDELGKVIKDYKNCPRVVEIYRLSGKFNLLFKGIFEDPLIFSSFIDELRSDPRIQSVELCVNCQQVEPDTIELNELICENSNLSVAPCGRRCDECNDYTETCPGCPATKWYAKKIFPIRENVVKKLIGRES